MPIAWELSSGDGSITPDAHDAQEESEPGHDGLHHLLLQEALDLDADVLSILFLCLDFLATCCSVAVKIRDGRTQDFVASLHASTGSPLLALCGGRGGRGGRGLGARTLRLVRVQEEEWRQEARGHELGSKDEDGGVEQIRVPSRARREEVGEEKSRRGEVVQSAQVGLRRGGQGLEGSRGRAGRGKSQESRDGQRRKGVREALFETVSGRSRGERSKSS